MTIPTRDFLKLQFTPQTTWHYTLWYYTPPSPGSRLKSPGIFYPEITTLMLPFNSHMGEQTVGISLLVASPTPKLMFFLSPVLNLLVARGVGTQYKSKGSWLLTHSLSPVASNELFGFKTCTRCHLFYLTFFLINIHCAFLSFANRFGFLQAGK